MPSRGFRQCLGSTTWETKIVMAFLDLRKSYAIDITYSFLVELQADSS
jgi:hypothetical protein